MPAATLSGNELTDIARRVGYSLGITASGQQLDGQTPPAGVGIRRATTNLFRRGQCDATTDYTTTSGATVATDPAVPPPFSTQSIRVTTDGLGANQGTLPVSGGGQAAAAGTSGAVSVYMKGVLGQSYSVLTRWVNGDATSTDGTPTIVTATGAWQLVTPAAVVVAVGKTGNQLGVRIGVNGTRAESFWVAHPMLESGQTVVAPYVASSGGVTAARAGGRVQVPATGLNPTVGFAALRTRLGWAGATGPTNSAELFCYGDGTLVKGCRIFWRSAGSGLEASRYNGSAPVGAQSGALSSLAGDVVTIIAAWTATLVNLSFNGSVFATAANTGIPALTGALLDIGNSVNDTTRQLDGDVLWCAVGAGTLTDADAAVIAALPDLRTLPNRRLMPWDFPAAARCQLVYDPRDNGIEFFRGAPGVALPGGVT